MTTYRIVRFFQRDARDREVIASGLTLEQAQAHCTDPNTSHRRCNTPEGNERTRLKGPWFDGYEREE